MDFLDGITSKADLFIKNKDSEKLTELAKEVESLLLGKLDTDFIDRYINSVLYYTVGNIYAQIYSNRDLCWSDENLIKPIYSFRKALHEIERVESGDYARNYDTFNELRNKILNNFTNWIYDNNRFLYGFKNHNEVIVESGLIESLISQADSLMRFAIIINEAQTSGIYIQKAKELLQDASEEIKLGGDERDEEFLKNKAFDYIDVLNKSYPYSTSLSRGQIGCTSINSKEDEYLNWIIGKNLFLNINSDIYPSNRSFHNDDISFNWQGDSVIQKNIKEIAEAFGCARSLYYQAGKFEEISFLIRGNQQDLNEDISINYIESATLQSAFKGFYSIFDKIAYLISRYYDVFPLNRDHQADFSRIFTQLLNTDKSVLKNPFIRALYFIYKDLYSNSKKNPNKVDTGIVLDPHLRGLNELRNMIEHRSCEIIESDWHLDAEDSRFDEQISETLEKIKNAQDNITYEKENEKLSILKDKSHTYLISKNNFERSLDTLAAVARNSIIYLILLLRSQDK